MFYVDATVVTDLIFTVCLNVFVSVACPGEYEISSGDGPLPMAIFELLEYIVNEVSWLMTVCCTVCTVCCVLRCDDVSYDAWLIQLPLLRFNNYIAHVICALTQKYIILFSTHTSPTSRNHCNDSSTSRWCHLCQCNELMSASYAYWHIIATCRFWYSAGLRVGRPRLEMAKILSFNFSLPSSTLEFFSLLLLFFFVFVLNV